MRSSPAYLSIQELGPDKFEIVNPNPRFARELEQTARKEEVSLLLRHSGKRSAQAAKAATQAGFRYIFTSRVGL